MIITHLIRPLVISVLLIGGTAATGLAQATPVFPTTTQQDQNMQNNSMHKGHRRGERGSKKNPARVSKQLERDIDMLKRDRHDYGGHREAAIDALQKARQSIEDAIEYDRTHPGQ